VATRVTETFFLPDEVSRKDWLVAAETYNLYHSLLSRSQAEHVFVPVRSMQFLAVMDRNEIIFVDSQAYAVSGNEGGRLILVSWQFPASNDRDSLSDPMPCQVVYYKDGGEDIQLRLTGEFRQSMELLDKRYRNSDLPPEGARILRLG